MDLGLNNKVAIVTGTNNLLGIGAVTALALAAEGAKVAMVHKPMVMEFNPFKTNELGLDWHKKKVAGGMRETEAVFKAKGYPYTIIEADVGDSDNIKNIYDAVERDLGPVDILVNNAAIYAYDDNIMMASDKVFKDVYHVNVEGPLYMIREFVWRFHDQQRTGGRIVNLSTDAAEFFASQVIFGSSKAALEAITGAVALEVAHLSITVNAIAPGPTQTGWLDEVSEQIILPSIPMGRVGTPEDIANAILFLVSAKASWITGQVIKVAGGHAI